MRSALVLLVLLSAPALADELDAHFDALRSPDEELRVAAAGALRAAGEAARERLELVLAPAEASPLAVKGSGRRRARVEAALLLADLADLRSLPALSTALAADEVELRAVASYALRAITNGGPTMEGRADDLLLWSRDPKGMLAAWRAWLASRPPAPTGEPLVVPAPTTQAGGWTMDLEGQIVWQIDLSDMLLRAEAPPIQARHAGGTRCRAQFAAAPSETGLALACRSVTTSRQTSSGTAPTPDAEDPPWDRAALELLLAGQGAPAVRFAATRAASPAVSNERQLLHLGIALATLAPTGTVDLGVAQPLPAELCAALSPVLYRGARLPPKLEDLRGRWTYLGRDGDVARFSLTLACERTGQFSLVGDRVRVRLAGTLGFDLARGRVHEVSLSGPATMAGPGHRQHNLEAKPGEPDEDLTRSPVWIHLALHYAASAWTPPEPGR